MTLVLVEVPNEAAVARLRQQHRTKLSDAVIAAPALRHALPRLTRNAGDFRAVAGPTVPDLHGSAPLLT